MKTTQGKATQAYITLANMSARVLPANAAYRLYKLKKALKDTFDFQTEEERKYVRELGGEVTENGQIILTEKEKKEEFAQKRKELEAMEIELKIDIPTVSINDMKEASLLELEALEQETIQDQTTGQKTLEQEGAEQKALE